MKCTLMPGIQSISGSFKQKDGSRIIFKTFSKPSANRKGKTETRMYVSHQKKRTKPLSENEIACRVKFAAARAYAASLTEEQRQQYREEWKSSICRFNGKLYVTLKGYIMARYYAEHPKNENGTTSVVNQ